ncbi:sensor histidine kinase [Sphingomonas sp. RB1R13]|uniref:sensor histidine kinase n=1 Tax=Sphingomonas sp. RB1R13 TaxID=3096159 RepID=UPI002FC9B0A7
MASAPDDPQIVTGRVDAAGRLVAADPPLAALQLEAGSSLGGRLALPQIAAVVRLARELGVPLSRPVTAAGANHDYDLWVRATLDGDEVALEIEGWRPRPAAAPRLDLVLAADDDATVARDPAMGEWATDSELKLTALAPDLAERLKIDPVDAMGQPLTRYLKLDEDDDGTLPLLAGLAARAPFSGQQASPRSGDGVSLLLSGEVLRDEAGKFAGFAGRALPPAPSLSVVPVAAPEGRGFTAGLDAALRSPLDRIIAAADKIVERSDGPLRSDYANYATDIAAAGRHLMSVIRTMSEGAAASHRVDLRGCANEAIAITVASAEARGVRVSINPSTAIFAEGEERGVVQILVNILGNAVRHSPNEGAVTISIVADVAVARVTISDQGPGIPLVDQQRIFQRFERLDSDAGGTGLGLAIARRLAQSMGGEVQLDSAPGTGARFTLELPLA